MATLRLLFLALIVGLSNQVEAANVSIQGSYCSIQVNVSGKITQEDIPLFYKLNNPEFLGEQQKKGHILCGTNKKPTFTFLLFSEGGDVDAALQIGKIIRSLDGSITIARNCASACIFLLAGGSQRTVVTWNGNLGAGIHRFYFSQAAGSNLKEIRYQREALKSRIVAFLRDMDISERVLEMSEGIPPENIRWLTSQEASELRLDGIDAAYDERETARNANEIGLNVVEYRSRKAQAQGECRGTSQKSIQEYEDCRNKILYRMSPAEYNAAQMEVLNKCQRIAGKEPNNPVAMSDWIERFSECSKRFPVYAR